MAGRFMTFADRPSGRDNGFNLIRVMAALAVIILHSVPLTGGEVNRVTLFADIVPGHVRQPLSNVLATAVAMLPLATLTWHLVEIPALDRKGRLETMLRGEA